MDRAPSSISPLAYCCYEVGVRLGQVLRLSKPGSPYVDENLPGLRPVVARLYASFVQLARYTDLTRTSLARIVARGGCRKHLEPLTHDWTGGSRAKTLIQEFRDSVNILATLSPCAHESASVLRDWFQLGTEIPNFWLAKGGAEWANLDVLTGLLTKLGVCLEDVFIDGPVDQWLAEPLFSEFDGYGWWSVEDGLLKLKTEAISVEKSPIMPPVQAALQGGPRADTPGSRRPTSKSEKSGAELSFERWDDIGIAIDSDDRFYLISPRPDAGSEIAMKKAKRLDLPPGQLPEVLKLLAESADGRIVRQDELIRKFKYDEKLEDYLSEAMVSDEAGLKIKSGKTGIKKRLRVAMANHGRVLRDRISVEEKAIVFEDDGQLNYRAAFVTRLLFPDKDKVRFGRAQA